MKAVTKITNKTNLPVNQLSRRQVIRSLSGAALIVATSAPAALANRQRTIRVAGVGTVYKQNSHCDVIFGKILEGWRHDNGPGPNMEIAGLFMDQFPQASPCWQTVSRPSRCRLSRIVFEQDLEFFSRGRPFPACWRRQRPSFDGSRQCREWIK